MQLLSDLRQRVRSPAPALLFRFGQRSRPHLALPASADERAASLLGGDGLVDCVSSSINWRSIPKPALCSWKRSRIVRPRRSNAARPHASYQGQADRTRSYRCPSGTSFFAHPHEVDHLVKQARVNTPPPKGGGFNHGSKPDWSAFGGHGASLGDVEVVVRFPGRLVLDVVYGCHACTLPSAPRSHPPEGVGFPDPLSGTLKQKGTPLRRCPFVQNSRCSRSINHEAKCGCSPHPNSSR